MRDVDDELLGDTERKEKGEPCAWDTMPEEILSDTDINDVWKRWKVALPVCSAWFLYLTWMTAEGNRAATYEFPKTRVDICATLCIFPALHI
jgi:hypothetical protein